jgi:hypothetical protein
MSSPYPYPCEKLAATCMKAELLERINRLQRALWFWLPGIYPEDPEIAERVSTDTLLLIGWQGELVQETAESLGWIRLRPVTLSWLKGLVEATTEIERLKRLTNEELATECAGLDIADHLIVAEMISRLYPGQGKEIP